ncbi:hypothetical protein EDEG_03661 [Edhazardia aedis USNM 41457]|uniref:C3H1-type domain-containing protein n=1 Tax=Edhazardia aedis (strain USNM 41457) TaxID=1003232 RepID=J9DKF2_EDHAE|nr:hypothetical protein EDEG_03661 [Edhazardia aedis USNM 41457]|eukprot:EJW01862.1 hypothetical protein EDEG_03661 [Edhazardia aedis USNM 41457]
MKFFALYIALLNHTRTASMEKPSPSRKRPAYSTESNKSKLNNKKTEIENLIQLFNQLKIKEEVQNIISRNGVIRDQPRLPSMRDNGVSSEKSDRQYLKRKKRRHSASEYVDKENCFPRGCKFFRKKCGFGVTFEKTVLDKFACRKQHESVAPRRRCKSFSEGCNGNYIYDKEMSIGNRRYQSLTIIKEDDQHKVENKSLKRWPTLSIEKNVVP